MSRRRRFLTWSFICFGLLPIWWLAALYFFTAQIPEALRPIAVAVFYGFALWPLLLVLGIVLAVMGLATRDEPSSN